MENLVARSSSGFRGVYPHRRRWPTSTPFKQCAKVAEEAGEVVGAAIKLDEARRTEQDVLDELADTVIAAIAAIQARNRDPRRVVSDRWIEVSSR
ncbi:hypothetical protein [Mycolicibacterium conceptionense]|uniref:hypothetical protein n=1 Tax=Mycolicibacterium conceptionense TaxID=451644 RepID=UPI001F2D5DC6|nr:hypothetical protein [Mycolicibacterium conceptionense]